MIKLLLLASAPVFIILVYIYYRDKYEKEPKKLLFEGLVAGGIIVFPIIYFEQLMASLGANLSGVPAAAWTAFMVAAFVEEGFKLFALMILIWRNPNFNEKFDGIVYAVFVSLGFALVENIMYVLGNANGEQVAISRAFTAVPAHAMFGVLMGYWLGKAKFTPSKRPKYLLLAFFMPFLFHGIYDFILMSELQVLLYLFFPFVIYLVIRGHRRINAHAETSAFKKS